MSGAGSLVDLDQQIILNKKYWWRLTDPNGGGEERDRINYKGLNNKYIC